MGWRTSWLSTYLLCLEFTSSVVHNFMHGQFVFLHISNAVSSDLLCGKFDCPVQRNLQEDLPRSVKSSITAKELNAHMSVMVRCPQYFGHIVNFMSIWKGWWFLLIWCRKCHLQCENWQTVRIIQHFLSWSQILIKQAPCNSMFCILCQYVTTLRIRHHIIL